VRRNRAPPLATTTAAPSPLVDEFEGLEDAPPTETTSAPPGEETLGPPVYTEADLIKPQSLYDSISEWLTSNLSEQEKLDITSDPILLTKDPKAKAKELQELQVELIMKSMKQPFKSKRPTAKTKKASKAKKTKPKSTFSKTDAAEKAEKTLNFDVDD
jgi:hypoxia up-regulated 1